MTKKMIKYLESYFNMKLSPKQRQFLTQLLGLLSYDEQLEVVVSIIMEETTIPNFRKICFYIERVRSSIDPDNPVNVVKMSREAILQSLRRIH